MDPLTLGLVGLAVLVVLACIAILKYATRETSFEQAYGENALKLLTEEKNKPKQKQVKHKKPAKTQEKKKEEPKEKPVPTPTTAPTAEPEPVEKPAASNGAETTKKGKNKKIAPAETPTTSAEPEKAALTKQESLESPSSEPENHAAVDGKTGKKHKKKNRARKDDAEPTTEADKEIVKPIDEQAAAVKESPKDLPKRRPSQQPLEEAIRKETTLETAVQEHAAKVITTKVNEQVQQSPSFEQAKEPKKRTKRTPVGEVTLEKLISRLASIEDVQPEYLAFLTHHVEESNTKENRLLETITTLKKQCSEREQSVGELKTQLKNNVAVKDAEIKHLYEVIKKEKEQHDVFEQTARPKIAEVGQLKDRVKHLEESLSASQQSSQAKDAQLPQLRRELDHLRAELTKTKATGDQLKAKDEELKKLEYERGAHLQLTQELRAASDHLQAELQQLRVELDGAKSSEEKYRTERHNTESAVRSLTEDVERLRAAYNAAVADREQASGARGELESVVEKFKREVEELRQELETASVSNTANDSGAHKSEVESRDVKIRALEAQLSAALQEQQQLKGQLNERVHDLTEANKELRRSLDAATQRLTAAEQSQGAGSSDLHRRNAELEAELSSLKSQLDEMGKKKNKSNNNNNNNVEVSAPAPAAADDELRKQVEELNRKNQELRERNYKLAEVMNEMEQTTKKMLANATGSKAPAQDDAKLKEVVAASTNFLRSLAPNGAKLPQLNGQPSVESYLSWVQEAVQTIKSAESKVPKASEASAPKAAAGKSSEEQHLREQLESYKKALSQVMVQLDDVAREAEKLDGQRRSKITQLERAIEQLSASAKPSTNGCAADANGARRRSSPESEEWEVVNESH